MALWIWFMQGHMGLSLWEYRTLWGQVPVLRVDICMRLCGHAWDLCGLETEPQVTSLGCLATTQL